MTPPAPGTVQTLHDGLRMVLAPNPGPMTRWGTNSFIVGEGNVAVVDPGPDDPAHLEALRTATRGETITHIIVTHAHADHSPLARRLSNETGAPIYGFGPPDAGRSDRMRSLAQMGLAGGGEGVDKSFSPDIAIGEADHIEGDGWRLEVLHTPGHFSGHLAFALEGGIISGDHVMDWSSSLISPPDGDLRAFIETSARLRDIAPERLFPGHGHPIDSAADRLGWLIEHREARETAIRDALGSRPTTLSDLTAKVYTDIPTAALLAAERNVFAHLIDLVDRNIAIATPDLSFRALFSLR